LSRQASRLRVRLTWLITASRAGIRWHPGGAGISSSTGRVRRPCKQTGRPRNSGAAPDCD
jgi:hypothetical protein